MIGTVSRLVFRTRQGDDSAVAHLHSRHVGQMLACAARKLSPADRRFVGVEDVVQEAFASFVRILRAGKYGWTLESQGLKACLLRLVGFKASMYRRARRAAKRGGGRVRGDSVWSSEACPVVVEAPAAQTQPDHNQRVQEWLEVLPEEVLREVAQWRLEGYSVVEIADRLGVCTRNVERKLARIRQIWSRHKRND